MPLLDMAPLCVTSTVAHIAARFVQEILDRTVKSDPNWGSPNNPYIPLNVSKNALPKYPLDDLGSDIRVQPKTPSHNHII